PDPSGAVRLMAQLGVLAAVMPEGANPGGLARLVAAGAPADPLLRLVALLTGDPNALADRLRLSGAERARLVTLSQELAVSPSDNDSSLRRALAETPADILLGRSWL